MHQLVEVDQFFQSLQDARLSVTEAEVNLQDFLDTFKVQLGLPPRIPVKLMVSLKQFSWPTQLLRHSGTKSKRSSTSTRKRSKTSAAAALVRRTSRLACDRRSRGPVIVSRFRHTLALGLRSLAAHRLRSVTALGIVLGVASVIVMLAVGEAARYQALKQLEDLGANTILLRSVKPTDDRRRTQGVDLLAYGLTYADLDRIRKTIPTVIAATPMREFRKTVRYADRKIEARVVAVTPAFLRQNNIQVALGRGIDDDDERKFDNVAVLGAAAAEKLFPTQDPIGRTVTVEDLDRPA